MQQNRFLRSFAAALLTAVLATRAAAVPASAPALSPREQALHVLNRLAFGPRPGDVERVLDRGPSAWIESQLSPQRIPDQAVEARLAGLETLTMSTAELSERFEKPFREAKKKLKAEKAAAAGGDAEPEGEMARMRETIPPEARPRRILEELTAARIVRASESQRQLHEVLVDFWMNHFNVFAQKGPDRIYITAFERDAIRPNVFGKFEDLLMATAKSPAMLWYLDNARSVASEENRPAAARRRLAAAPRPENAPRGLNENYARELLELHTLGVDGGYTQKDVTELARVLTGWSIARPDRGRGPARREEAPGTFVFRGPQHDVGAKTVLGQRIASGGGIEEGERMIRFLASRPATARHIAYKLAQRLVADEPPAALVDRVAATFLSTGGDLRETVRAVVTSPEFFDPRHYRAKMKAPFEYVVSAVRAMGGSTDGRAIARQIAEMGEPLYLCQPPTGYSDTAEAWVGSGALMARWNFALDLAANRVRGSSVDPDRLLAPSRGREPEATADTLARTLIGEPLAPETRDTIRQRLADHTDPADPTALIVGLILGSPEFQRQ